MLIYIMVLDILILFTSKMLFPVHRTNLKLSKYFREFREIEIVFRIFSDAYRSLVIVLIFVGVIMASCAGSMTILWYGKIHILIYILMPVLLVNCFIYVLFLTCLANIPYKNSKRFLKFWQLYVRKKEELRNVRGCRPIGLNAGPYGMVTNQLGILICDDIIHNMITIILLDNF